jgi:hypothetical protein
VDEVKPEHNHLFDPERAQNSKSHKKLDADVEVRILNCIEQLLETHWAMEAHSTPQVLFCFCFSSYFITTDQTLFSIKHQPTNSKSILDMCCTTNVKRYCSSTYF